MDLKSKIVLISGPTASGKSSFAIKVAKKINGEIINADSMQIYKQLKILSARPDPKKYQLNPLRLLPEILLQSVGAFSVVYRAKHQAAYLQASL